MALDGSITKVSTKFLDDGELLVLDVQGPSAYDAAGGGEDLTANPLGLTVGSRLDAAEGRAADPAQGYAKLDPANGRLRFYTAADAEQANLADLSANTYRLTIQGR